MNMQDIEFDIAQLVLSSTSFGPQDVEKISTVISEDFSQYRALRDAVGELETHDQQTPASSVRLGVCYYLMGRYQSAVNTLKQGDGGALVQFYLGKSYFAQNQYADAQASYQAAAAAGYNGDLCMLAVAESQRCAGESETAIQTLDNLFGAVEQTAEYLYQRAATVSALGGNPSEVRALYSRAVEVDAAHPGALFGLALENDRAGNDADALRLYETSASRFPSHVGSLLNLGLMYEDLEKYERAAGCYQRILDVYPDHTRAGLFLKDTQASGDMYYDDDERKQTDRLGQVLGIPVTDFELSVRSRNCLQRMGILTLGDLAQATEHELLSSKNFGETSLVEIREILGAKGLKLGELAHQRQESLQYDTEVLSDDDRVAHERPISELNLSVRARKCMVRLGINSFGELLRRTGDELLECKNFGVTSLNEVREKLTPLGLKLRGD